MFVSTYQRIALSALLFISFITHHAHADTILSYDRHLGLSVALLPKMHHDGDYVNYKLKFKVLSAQSEMGELGLNVNDVMIVDEQVDCSDLTFYPQTVSYYNAIGQLLHKEDISNGWTDSSVYPDLNRHLDRICP